MAVLRLTRCRGPGRPEVSKAIYGLVSDHGLNEPSLWPESLVMM